jgi:4-amino-4-deoxy-L-arabinose transferase-like glycosyltransferase
LQTTLVVISFALTYTNLRFLRVKPGNEPYWDAFALWVISSLTFAAAFVRWPRLDWAGVRAWAYRNRADLWLAAGLTGAAALFRFWQLGALPNVISGDEGRIGLLAESVIKGEINNMLATLYGHGTLYLFIMAGFMKLFGAGTVGLRITSAAAGTLAVPALYLLGRRLFNVRVACVAAALMAVSHFHLHFSRIIVAGSIQDALWSTLVFYLFLTGLEQKSAGRMTLSGLTLGVYVHVYMGARLLYLLLPVYVACLLIRDRDLVRQNLGNLLAFLGALIAASAPMGLWAYLHPDEFMARANQVGILQSGWLVNEAQVTGKTQLGILVEQLRQAFLTVNYYPATGFYYAKLPMLDFVSGAVFMLGIAYSLYHVFDRRHLLLQGWFWSGVIVGGALVVLPGDAAYRILIIFPAVCLFVALGWDRLAAFASQALASRPARTGAVTALFVAAIAIPNLKAYLLDYAPTCRYEDWGTRYASRMGTIIGRLGPRYAPYLLGAPRIYYGIHPSVDFLSNGVPVTNVNDVLTAPPTALDPRARVVFFIIPERENELAFIQAQLPGGEVQRIYDCTDLQMITYKYDGSPAP